MWVSNLIIKWLLHPLKHDQFWGERDFLSQQACSGVHDRRAKLPFWFDVRSFWNRVREIDLALLILNPSIQWVKVLALLLMIGFQICLINFRVLILNFLIHHGWVVNSQGRIVGFFYRRSISFMADFLVRLDEPRILLNFKYRLCFVCAESKFALYLIFNRRAPKSLVVFVSRYFYVLWRIYSLIRRWKPFKVILN